MPTCALPGCTRPVHIDPTSGIAHNYCGRTHASEALGGGLAAPHGVCHTCKLPGCNEPVLYDNGRVHEYCCRRHADEALARGLRPASNRPLQGQSTPANRCSLPGCSAPRFVDPTNGFIHDFCGRTHAREATSLGLLPAAASGVPAAAVERVWRGRAGEPAYTLSVLTNAHPKYEGIKQQFRDAWEHTAQKPIVCRVLQVCSFIPRTPSPPPSLPVSTARLRPLRCATAQQSLRGMRRTRTPSATSSAASTALRWPQAAPLASM